METIHTDIYESQLNEIGIEIAKLLYLKKNKKNKYNTAYGDKTKRELTLSIIRIIKEIAYVEGKE